jgi:hypothetical protein
LDFLSGFHSLLQHLRLSILNYLHDFGQNFQLVNQVGILPSISPLREHSNRNL